ncbi:hypothetical protein MNB_SV-13-288 [hydrothermal vent metagenome]|uniref:Uncharacterized protein n=1 Tax=hydrothermal vent metagenome TaxID=652676 RepID=A0A1W1CZL0_9ZZZZ
MKKYLFPALVIALTFMAIMAFQQAKPTPKAPIYKEVQKYSPYYLDKRFGGLQIMSKTDKDFKEKPTNMEVFHRLEFLEKEWGKSHLKVESQKVIVLDNNKTEIANINLSSDKDKQFIHSFYGI